MADFYPQFMADLLATSLWEWLAVMLALAYIILAIRESLWCWPAAFVSTAIYAVLFFDVNLYMESLLNLYYLGMAIYGWYQWQGNGEIDGRRGIIKWSLKRHLLWVSTLGMIVLGSSYFLNLYTDQDMALLDSFTTWFAVFTTYMVAKKVLENWLYWIIIDAVSIYIYLSKGFALTSVLFLIYILLAAYGWLKWKKSYEQQSNSTA